MRHVISILAATALTWVSGSVPARAAVSTAQAEQLNSTFTPVGAERAGNKDHTIPPWTGGYATTPPGYREGDVRPDPFAGEKPLFAITSKNMDAYADHLPEGAKALFRRYADYRMDIYPTHRSAAAPPAVYASIFLNATRAHAAPEGIAYGVEGAAGGIPFPIPQNGFEAMWNHLLAFWGPAREVSLKTWIVSADGAAELATGYRETTDFPYYYPGAAPQSAGGYYFKTLRLDDAPPTKVGEGYLDWQPLDSARYGFNAWRILPGEHRVRRGPGITYDTPDSDASGLEALDEYYIFFGGLDRYDFKLVGKKEMFIPYNNNRLYMRPTAEILGAKHANPDDLRYELHRVWVVDGTLKPGAHDVVARRRLYLDEDSWFAVYSDSWDDSGRLWKFGHATMYLMPEIPAVILGSQFVYDLTLGGYVYGFAFNDQPQAYKVTAPHPANLFTPQSMAARAVR
ncbi:MAG TPA: DUF1329 domain-containing protein [Rhizomicrobium sp.]|nr:DUF1329 domain-containing protein [Rhizomicrobium sp.]